MRERFGCHGGRARMLPEAHTGRARRREWLALRPEKAECFYEVDNFSESPAKVNPKKGGDGLPFLTSLAGVNRSKGSATKQDEK